MFVGPSPNAEEKEGTDTMTTGNTPAKPFTVRKKIAEEWTGFNDAELDEIGDNAGRLVEALQRKHGLAREDAERQVRRFVNRAWQEHRQAEWLAS